MMWTAFGATNYKSLRSVEFPMRPFMVLVGPNGAGKTNIVQAMDLLGRLLYRGTTEPARDEGWDQIVRRAKKPARGGVSLSATISAPLGVLRKAGISTRERNLPLDDDAVQVSVSITLAGSTGSEEIGVKEERVLLCREGGGRVELVTHGDQVDVDAGDDRALWSLVAAGVSGREGQLDLFDSRTEATEGLKKLFSASTLRDDTERKILRLLNPQRHYTRWLRRVAEVCSVQRLRLDSSSLRDESILKESRSLGATGERLAAAVDQLRGRGTIPSPRFGHVLDTLRIVYPRLEDVIPQRRSPGRLALQFKERGIAEPLDTASISDGVLHALALVIALESPAFFRGLLVIEEPENAIHPWALKTIVESAQAHRRRQLLFTTHSSVVVSTVRDPESLFVVEQGDQGTRITPASEREGALAAIMESTGQKLGDIWMDGSVGGVPTPDERNGAE